MDKLKSIDSFKKVVLAGALFDLCGGVFFALMVGANKLISKPPTDPFYSMLIAAFLFCLAYLQFMSVFNLKRYLLNIGVSIMSRVLFGILFFAYLILGESSPIIFLPTALADLILASLTFGLVLTSKELSIKNLFFPFKE